MADSPRPRRALLVGAAWGLGHTLALTAFGAVLLALELELPARAGEAIELGVSCMLVGLGLASLRRAFRPARVDAPPRAHHVGRRPVLVGLVHGLAGSGALAAVAVTRMSSLPAAIVYVVVFGLGSLLGMGLVTLLAGLSLERVTRTHRARTAVLGLAGLASVAVGVGWGAPVALGWLGAA